jgi:hypothetical protein
MSMAADWLAMARGVGIVEPIGVGAGKQLNQQQ